MNPAAIRTHYTVVDADSPVPAGRAPVLAAAAGAVGGPALFADLSLHVFGPLHRTSFIGLRGAVTTGWRRSLAVAGSGVVTVGAAAWITAFLPAFLNGGDADPGPNGVLLGSWGLLWAWAAWAGVTAKKQRGRS